MIAQFQQLINICNRNYAKILGYFWKAFEKNRKDELDCESDYWDDERDENVVAHFINSDSVRNQMEEKWTVTMTSGDYWRYVICKEQKRVAFYKDVKEKALDCVQWCSLHQPELKVKD